METDAEADIEVARRIGSHRLSLRDMGLRWVPTSIAALGGDLIELDLSKNELLTLPDEIGRLGLVCTLNCFENQLVALPSTLCEMRSLRVLKLWGNSLDGGALARCNLHRLYNLRELHLHRNELQWIPGDIGALPLLEFLNLSNNRLSSLPEEFALRASSLRTLALNDNALTDLPWTIAGMRSLSSLHVAHNALVSSGLPTALWALSALRTLDLSYNKLSELPSGIGDLANLADLRLSGNALSGLPSELGRITSLEALYAADNLLASVPASLFLLPKLQECVLDGNPLAALPLIADVSTMSLAPLNRLSLRSTRISLLPPNSVVWALGASLCELDLCDNPLLTLLDDVGSLRRLTSLRLAHCALAELPASIGELARLERLDVADNALTAVHSSVGRLPRLRWLRLDGNPLADVPPWLVLLPETAAVDVSLARVPVVVGESALDEEAALKRWRAVRFAALRQRLGQAMNIVSADDTGPVSELLAPPPSYETSQRLAEAVEAGSAWRAAEQARRTGALPVRGDLLPHRLASSALSARDSPSGLLSNMVRKIVCRTTRLFTRVARFWLVSVFRFPILWVGLQIAVGKIRAHLTGQSVEALTLSRVYRDSFDGDAESVLRSIDAIGYSQEYFLMNIGDVKGVVIDDAMRRVAPKVVVELGGYIGYSAVRIARMLRSGGHLYSIEADPMNAAIAASIVERAGMSSRVTIIVGKSNEVLPTLKERYNIQAIDLLFIDHWKSLYLPDIKLVEELGLLRDGSEVLADNVIFPGTPDYLAYIRSHPKFTSTYNKLSLEYTPEIEDGVEVSVYHAN